MGRLIKSYFIIFIIIGISACSMSSNNFYQSTVTKLQTNKEYKEYVKKTLELGGQKEIIIMMSLLNTDLFETGHNRCDLNNIDNLCFQSMVKIEAMLNIANQQGYSVDTAPFYVWKEAVLRGENIQPYLDSLVSKTPTP